REAVACLGDFVGLTPTILTNFSVPGAGWGRLHPSGRIAIIGLEDGSATLRDTATGDELARLPALDRHGAPPPFAYWTFGPQGNQIFCVTRETNRQVRVWGSDPAAHWRLATNFSLPGPGSEVFNDGKDAFSFVVNKSSAA